AEPVSHDHKRNAKNRADALGHDAFRDVRRQQIVSKNGFAGGQDVLCNGTAETQLRFAWHGSPIYWRSSEETAILTGKENDSAFRRRHFKNAIEKDVLQPVGVVNSVDLSAELEQHRHVTS